MRLGYNYMNGSTVVLSPWENSGTSLYGTLVHDQLVQKGLKINFRRKLCDIRFLDFNWCAHILVKQTILSCETSQESVQRNYAICLNENDLIATAQLIKLI